MSEEDAIALIRKLQGDLNQTAYAAKIGITKQHLSDIYNRKRNPGATVLDHFDMEKTRRVVVEYRFKRRER